MTRVLTEHDKHQAFLCATRGFANAGTRWQERAARGLTDAELAAALEYELGIEGGASSTDSRPAYHMKGAGLQIWAGWEWPNPYENEPIFKGAATIAKAREVYGIADPSQRQLALF
jgi:hypothetical protein